MRMLLTSVGLCLILILVIALWSSWPWGLSEKNVSFEVVHVEPEEMIDEIENPSVIKVLSWNLGFLYGRGSDGREYVYREKEFYQARLDSLVNEIKEWSPDIICFQEIDFDSSRSHGINQAEYVAVKAGYPFVAEVPAWESNYIPYPYWPVKDNFGRMKSGGAILSRFPIIEHEAHLLEKPQSQPWWYNLFYPHRYFQKVTLIVGKNEFKLINLHLEAFDKNDRQIQLELLTRIVDKEGTHVVAGDFNMLPPSATKRSKFYNNDDYENDTSYEVMGKSGLLELVPDDIYVKNEQNFFTFPAWAPERRLDYIFYRSELKMMKAEVLPSALSDHLPIRASFQIDSPKFNPYSQ